MVCLFQFPREEKGSNYCIVVAPKSNWSPSTTFLSRVRPSSNKLYQTKREKLRSSSITLPTRLLRYLCVLKKKMSNDIYVQEDDKNIIFHFNSIFIIEKLEKKPISRPSQNALHHW